jgi:hypothetical protein
MIFAYPRGRWLTGAGAQDIVLAVAIAVTLAVGPGGMAGAFLCAACAAVLLWGVTTIHFPSRVVITDEGIAFHGYGRAHHFAWSAVRSLRVRRFLVKDRVLVRIGPASAWRGRYWLTSSIADFDALVRELEERSR